MIATSGMSPVSRNRDLPNRLLGLALAAWMTSFAGGAAAAASPALKPEGAPAELTAPEGQAIRAVRIDIGQDGFHPRSVNVRTGETVRFVIRNTTGRTPHDFTVGTRAMQIGRRELIKEMIVSTPIETRVDKSSPFDAPNAVVVLPGETRELVWTFTGTRRFSFRSNIPGPSHVSAKGAFRLMTAGDNELDFPAVDRVPPARLAVASETPRGRDEAAPGRTTLADVGKELFGVKSANAALAGRTALGADAAGEVVFAAPRPSGRPDDETDMAELVSVGEGVFGFSQSNVSQAHGTPEIEGVTPSDLQLEDEIDEVTRLGRGHELLAKGRVVEARKLYTLSFEAGLLEAAFALGRSYDPRTVSMLHEPDAEPDQDRARHWYEVWYRRSVEEGAVSGAVRLDMLLKGMSGG